MVDRCLRGGIVVCGGGARLAVGLHRVAQDQPHIPARLLMALWHRQEQAVRGTSGMTACWPVIEALRSRTALRWAAM